MRTVILAIPLLTIGCGETSKHEPQKEQTKQPHSGAASVEEAVGKRDATRFDPRSLENTIAWIAAQKNLADKHDNGSNELAVKEAEAQFRSVIQNLKDTAVDWPAKCANVKSDGTVVLAVIEFEIGMPHRPDTKNNQNRRHIHLALEPNSGTYSPPWESNGFHSPPRKGFPADLQLARKLKAGDMVRLSSKVTSAQRFNSFWETETASRVPVYNYGAFLTLFLKDATVSEAIVPKP